MPPRVVIVGPPGAGKTSVGRALARRLEIGFRDTDADVEAVAGVSVADVFVEHGEARFRELERAAVQRALTEHDGVLALGGGAVLDEGARASLRGHTVVFLDVGIADAARRVGFNRDRPLLLGNPRAQWLKLMEQRRPLYAAVATHTVSTDGIKPAAVVDRILDVLDVA
ncbi:MAG: shikimate kinase [Candidatus Nanopelagicales bacterium]